MNIGIIGCGLIGNKRAHAMQGSTLLACADSNFTSAENLAKQFPNCIPHQDYQTLLSKKDIDAVIIATPHVYLTPITLAAIHAGKHVLVEKPAACTVSEINTLLNTANEKNVHVRVGFNHRYHRTFRKASDCIAQGDIGELMYVRGRYGHGGRLGYEKEWRANPTLSGGGELIDQGVHLIDLARFFLGDFTEAQGIAHTYFWNMPVEDNGFLLLKTAQKKVAFLHASCTEWKNLFSFEIYGKQGKIEINGLGGSYGTEKLTLYKMLPQMGPPETTHWEYPMADDSWAYEFNEFITDITLNRKPQPGLHDAKAALEVVEKVLEVTAA